MAYHRHDPTQEHPGYHGETFFEEEHKYETGKYHLKDEPFNAVYGSNEKKEDEEKKESEFEKQLDEEKSKEEKQVDEEAIKKKAAEEVFRETEIKDEKRTKTSIEDAIEKAIREEKEIVHLER